ncbi:hypothetical protein HL667_01560 [Bradyrhizobium sp. 83012]|uniref:Integrase DNA-binding domain-containing protein n=1 Tax=Bradyrhizobium aeschynomenes TaxID=2734909 RepID=A0ABX2C5V9_9BRAD|nr:hypothetical protein [Bradyrhizobium aeschynomenes]NPU63677.1 hypothetical protein [Bradyrhizobium aeschynomenes]
MVERSRLTSQIVDNSVCPIGGERWIADTEVPGFGLRLWRTKHSCNKAFALRVSDPKGRMVRRTYNPKCAWQAAFDRTDPPSSNLGRFLNEAREWAEDEIARIKGRPTKAEADWEERKSTGAVVRKLTLETAASSILKGLYAKGRSERYKDRLDKLFALYVPQKIKHVELGQLDPVEVARTLVQLPTSDGNIRTLRSFISQIMERGASFAGNFVEFHDEFAREFSSQWAKVRQVQYPELNELSTEKYETIFKVLETEDELWQQALAIRLYFAFRRPLCRVTQGSWRQIYGGFWYPYWPDEKAFWFECRESITNELKSQLNRIAELVKRDFVRSTLWFPSHHNRNGKPTSPIQSVEHMWRIALKRASMRYYPLREFSRSYREFNNPSYYLGFIRQYGATFRESQNEAKLSTILTQRRKTNVCQYFTDE